MKMNQQKEERIKRIRSISNQVNFNNKLQTASFKLSSRNKTSMLSSKGNKLANKSSKKLIVVSHKMIAHRTQKSKGSKIGEKYHSVDSGIKVCCYWADFNAKLFWIRGIKFNYHFRNMSNSQKGFNLKDRQKVTGSCWENKEDTLSKQIKPKKKSSKLSSNNHRKVPERKTFEPQMKMSKVKITKSKKSLFQGLSHTTSMDEKKFINRNIKNQNCKIFLELFRNRILIKNYLYRLCFKWKIF